MQLDPCDSRNELLRPSGDVQSPMPRSSVGSRGGIAVGSDSISGAFNRLYVIDAHAQSAKRGRRGYTSAAR